MKVLKIGALLLLVAWAAWVSLTLIQIKAIAIEACGIAMAHGEDDSGSIHIPVVCPNLDYGEEKQGKPPATR